MTNRTVTIAEVAAAAGVSIPTVSKVLNGRKGVSPALAARSNDCSTNAATSGGSAPVGALASSTS